MTDVMQGVRVLEVAEHTFVPAASAILAEWGAEVIKIEHVERGDAMRGLASSGTVSFGDGVHVLLEHSNRGKKSIGLDLTQEAGLDVLYALARTCDVFLTNKLPSVLERLRVDRDTIQAQNPDIIYVSGHGQGARGPDADKGSYDSLGYWARSGVALGQTPEGAEPINPPAPAFGDSIGAMTIAGGIMGALFHRERTGEATDVDISLMACGMWSMGAAVALSLQLGSPWRGLPAGASTGNPLTGSFTTSDGRQISLTCLQAARYWPEACRFLGLDDYAEDERFADTRSITENSAEATALVAGAFATRTMDEWRDVLQDFSGQWCAVQDVVEATNDPQSVANGYVQDYETADGTPFQLVSPPVQYGGTPATPRRAPDFNEHADEILAGIGLDTEEILELKLQNVVA